MLKHAKQSLVYTAIFCLGYFIACGGGGTVQSTSAGGGPTPTGTVPQMVSSDWRPVALAQSGTGVQSALAALLWSAGFSARSKATITNPSAVGQSYESDCAVTYLGGGGSPGIHRGLYSGLLSIPYRYADWEPCSGIEWLASVGADENGNPQGYPVVLDGTINTLVAYGTFVSGNRWRCVDTTNTTALSDGSVVRAYYDLAHDAIILGSGTTQLSLMCSITIPSGDDVMEVHVQWLKS